MDSSFAYDVESGAASLAFGLLAACWRRAFSRRLANSSGSGLRAVVFVTRRRDWWWRAVLVLKAHTSIGSEAAPLILKPNSSAMFLRDTYQRLAMMAVGWREKESGLESESLKSGFVVGGLLFIVVALFMNQVPISRFKSSEDRSTSVPLSHAVMAAAPVLVREYTTERMPLLRPRTSPTKSLPPVASFAFADILRAADGPGFQSAIDGIAEIAAKSRMSLADEYASHMPPLGTITATTPAAVRTQLHVTRPGMRRALTSVPEGSSGSSEGSRLSKKKRTGLFNFRRQREEQNKPLRTIRIGSMGRTISVGGTTALATMLEDSAITPIRGLENDAPRATGTPTTRRRSLAESSLQRLLGHGQLPD